MGFELRSSMFGIEECLVVLIFLSKEYMNKVCENHKKDNCVYEYTMTMNWKAGDGADDKNMFIPVIMESFKTDSGFMFPDDPKSWKGRFAGEIGPTMMQVRMNDSFGDDDALDKKVDELEKALFKLLPEKEGLLRQDATMSSSSRSQVVSITSANYHLISPSIESACAVVMFITDTFDRDKYSQLELSLACAFNRPAVPVLVGISRNTSKWPPPGYTHGLAQEQCLHIKSLSQLDTPEELKQFVTRILLLVSDATHAPQRFLLRPIVTAAPIRRSMPTRQQDNARPVALGATRAPLKVYSQAQIQEMTENFSGRRVLGQGGSGKVYRGSCEDGSESAVKILHYEGVSDETKAELMRHMAREVRFLQRVHSPFIVTLLGVQKLDSGTPAQSPVLSSGGRVSTQGVCALVYEYCQLGSLEDALMCRGEWNRKPISGTLRFELLCQACIGLLELHSQDILHLDFKPANVLLDGSPAADRDPSSVSARIGDFGMAKRVHQLSAAPENSTLPTHTNRSQVWMTEGYACPEYVQTKKGSDRTDVYAMGITIFRVVTGQQPSGRGGVTLKTSIEIALRRASPDAIETLVTKLCDPAARWCRHTALRLLKLGLRCVANLPDDVFLMCS